ncbi:uncharacterized protein J4E78_000781 [Alternaria triticimaculans]|uniref:uncharacterized protein n=1 Tax=Alternaria triticimaculans TaxID=297637 RepID=UPI0020C30117|nr:uncharacterized protein J4E78_000781 [Alternaria triticimaculans]KAI4672281.1 hypothetical protein J4E78_000781 [Alternaria triticimaculans]
MPRKSPPYKSGLPYFKRDCEAYFPTNASTVTWSRAEQNNTVNTLWYGSRIIRDYYNARIGRRELFGLPTPNPIPDNPFNASDVTFARTNKSMPTYRDGLGGTEPAWVNAPAGFGALAMTVPPPAVVVAGPVAAPVRAVTVSQPRPVNRYPFNFWPPKPWDAEPDDATLGMTIKAIKSKEEPENAESAWPPITHLDISLSNIFLEPAADDAYPNCVLSDFGMAMYDLEQSDPAVRPSDNPQEYVLGHTSCKYPPEQQLARGTPPDLTPLNEKSDVWSIGAAVWYMIANRSVAGPQRELHYSEDMPQNVNIGEADHGRLDEPGAKPFEGLGFPALSKYSEELRSLVARCMNWEQEHRPDLATLRAKINAYLASHPKVKDSRDFGPLRMSNLEQGLGIGDTFVRKRRKPVAGKQARKRRKEDEDNSEE